MDLPSNSNEQDFDCESFTWTMQEYVPTYNSVNCVIKSFLLLSISLYMSPSYTRTPLRDQPLMVGNSPVLVSAMGLHSRSALMPNVTFSTVAVHLKSFCTKYIVYISPIRFLPLNIQQSSFLLVLKKNLNPRNINWYAKCSYVQSQKKLKWKKSCNTSRQKICR